MRARRIVGRSVRIDKGNVFSGHIRRWRKGIFALVRPTFWPALATGVVPAAEHVRLLRDLECDLVIDVGANRGQFSLISRAFLSDVPIIAFEPVPDSAATFRRVFQGVAGVELHETALGETCGQVDFHLSRKNDNSSVLQIGDEQRRLFPGTEEVGVLRVPIATLDSIAPRVRTFGRVLLKLDVQGSELSVLRGAELVLQRCAFVYVECSERELYLRQPLRSEIESYLGLRGFRMVTRQNETFYRGELVQADYLFARLFKVGTVLEQPLQMSELPAASG